MNGSGTANWVWLLQYSDAGTFECPSALDTSKRGNDYIPEEWTIETY